MPDIQQERASQRLPWDDPYADVPAAGCYTGQYIGPVGRTRICSQKALLDGTHPICTRDELYRFTGVRTMSNPPQHPEPAGYKIPGYLGFVPGLTSENCHGASYASLATEAAEVVHGRVKHLRASGSKQRLGRASTSCPELVRPPRGAPHSCAALALKGPRPWL